jgi:NADH:ubiquinone reductase (H+-translocating)
MKIVIIGAGFGGLRLARKLNNKKGIEVLLIDKFNYHQFQPLFYQVATGGLDASNISFPLRKVFQRSRNVRIRMGEVKKIDPAGKVIYMGAEHIGYDALVIATGAGTNFFGNTEIEKHALPMKSTVEALQIKYRLLQNFEKALSTKDENILKPLMNIAIVGGGPTGVELAGAIAEMKKYVLPKDYPELDFRGMNIYMVEGSHRLLAAMSERSSAQSLHYLQKMGVNILQEKHVTGYDGENLAFADGSTLQSNNVIWAAGIKGNIVDGIDKRIITRANRINIDKLCRVSGMENVYAIGDIAYEETEKFPKGLPQVAPVAIQQADLLAYNFRMQAKGNSTRREFRYRDKGAMATVGRNKAVVDIPRPKVHLGGILAWLIWMTLHLMLILGVKNRFFIFINWLYSYFTRDQNLRLIFRNPPES